MSPLTVPAAPLALTTVSATILAGLMLARYAGSRARLVAREREHLFTLRIERFLLGAIRGRELLVSAAVLDPDRFWDAVASVHPNLPSRAARDLEQTLERSRHVRAERHALADSSPIRRELAARRLALLGALRHRHALRRAMVAGPESVTLAAATALARIRDRGALRWVLAHPRSLEHRPPQHRLALLRGFGPSATEDLAAALSAGVGEPRMERAVIEALAHAGASDAIPAIAARLGHEWRDVRVAAARALGLLGAREHAPAIAAALGDPAWQVRAQAARALGRLGGDDALPPLRAALRDAAWWVRRHAAYALAERGDRGRDVLREVAAADEDRYARDIAAEALQGGFPALEG